MAEIFVCARDFLRSNKMTKCPDQDTGKCWEMSFLEGEFAKYASLYMRGFPNFIRPW